MKKRVRQYVLCFILSFIVLFRVALPSIAEEIAQFIDNADFLQDYESGENQLLVYMKNVSGDSLTIDKVSAELGDVKLQVLGLTTAREVPVTYYCIVDVSGSISDEQIGMGKKVLNSICDGMQTGDQMVVAAMGNQTNASRYLTDQAEIRQAIEALAVTKDDTNLYKAIADGIRLLWRSNEANKRKCLVVISDGKDEQMNGQTRRDADREITDSRIPVYTVALNTADHGMKSKWTEYAKQLGSFARESVGGEHYSMSERDPVEAGSDIVSSMKNVLILTLKLTDSLPRKEELLLKVNIDGVHSDTFGDTIKVYAGNLDIVSEEAALDSTGTVANSNESVTDTVTIGTTQDDPVKPDPPDPDYLPWIIGAIFLILLVAGLVMAVKNKDEQERKSDDEGNNEVDSVFENDITENPGIIDYAESLSSRDDNTNTSLSEVAEAESKIQSRKLVLKAIGYPDIVVTLKVREGQVMTIGRDQSADFVINDEDRKLSRINSRILLRDDMLKVWDAGSRNGTSVNGVPIHGENAAFLRDGDTLRMGSFEYRVHF